MRHDLHYYHWACGFKDTKPRNVENFWEAIKHIGHLKIDVVSERNPDGGNPYPICTLETDIEELKILFDDEDAYKRLKRRHRKCLHKCVDDEDTTDMDIFQNRRLYLQLVLDEFFNMI